jgi:phage terminase small subunit
MQVDRRLPWRQQLFCFEYIKDFNGTAAYKRAYSDQLSDDTAANAAKMLLKKPEIQQAIAEHKEEHFSKFGVSRESIIAGYAKVAEADMNDFITVDEDGMTHLRKDFDGTLVSEITTDTIFVRKEGEGDDERTIEKVRTKIKLHDPLKARDALAKINKMFIEKHEHEHTIKNISDFLESTE